MTRPLRAFPLPALLLAASASAQQSPLSRLTFDAAAGPSFPAGVTSDKFTTGAHFHFGAGYNLTRRFGLAGEFWFAYHGLTRSLLDEFAAPDGDSRMFLLTAEPYYRFLIRGPWTAYVIGGGGLYRRSVEFTETTSAPTLVTDPFLGLSRPTPLPAGSSIPVFNTNAFGLNAGAGFSRAIARTRAAWFLEFRYHHAFTPGPGTVWNALSAGLRWN
jgi:hypothetical protein